MSDTPRQDFRTAEIERLEARLAEETAIVNRIWDQLGWTTYGELAGRGIYDLIEELKHRAETAETDVKALEAARGELNEAAPHRTTPEEFLQLWLVTYAWRRPGGHWKIENAGCVGCTGVWWADYLEGDGRDGGLDRDADKNVYRFLGATSISLEAYERLAARGNDAERVGSAGR
jgi:hypothetical protein